MTIPPPSRRNRSCRRPGEWLAGSRLLAAAVILVVILVLALPRGMPGMAVAAEDITGVWLTDDGRAAIEIRPCGADRCGYIVWMGPDSEGSETATDRNNPDPKLRSRRMCGLQIISGLRPQPDGSWGGGRVYNPESGRTFGMKIRRLSADAVRATGYIGLEFLGQSMEWRRAPNNLRRCDRAAR